MFRSMRRSRQQLENDETIKILRSGTTGVLGLTGDDGYPYTVPINYVYENGKIYFHGARSGHKYDSIKSHDKVSLCVIEKEDIIKEELTTYPVRTCQDPGNRRGDPPCRQGLQPPIQRRPGFCGKRDPERMEQSVLCGDFH